MNIEKLLNPKSIAVVGASSNVSRVGGRLYNNLVHHGYEGDIYLVNPKRHVIGDMKCYSRLSDIPHPVEGDASAALLVQVHSGLCGNGHGVTRPRRGLRSSYQR